MSINALNSCYINPYCYVCHKSNYINNPKKIIVCIPDDKTKHWSHKKCQREWAMHKRDIGLPASEITCGQLGTGVCKTNLVHLLPALPQKSCMEKTVDFFRAERPNLGGAVIAIFHCLSSTLYIGLGANLAIEAGKVIGTAGSISDLKCVASVVVGTALAGWGGRALGAIAGIHELLDGEPLPPRAILRGTASTALAVGLGALRAGGGWPLAGALSALTAVSTYFITKGTLG